MLENQHEVERANPRATTTHYHNDYKSAVKNYSDLQLLNKVKSLSSFVQIPSDYWLLGVQSNEDNLNKFDDKFYLFCGHQFIFRTFGTTNAGKSGLYNPTNSEGVAIIKTNEWYYDLWRHGYHKGRMKALVQNKPVKFYRDNNKNDDAEEIGRLYEDYIGINFHTVSYDKNAKIIKEDINGWSLGCQVINNTVEYYQILDILKNQLTVTYCLLKEF